MRRRSLLPVATLVMLAIAVLAIAGLVALLRDDTSEDVGLVDSLPSATSGAPDATATSSGDATPTPDATATEPAAPTPAAPTPTRTAVPGPPYTSQIISEYVPYPLRIDHLVQSSDLIVVGRVVEVLPARWTTPDGQRPVDPFAMERHYTIITPAVLEIDETLVDRAGLDLEGEEIIVATEGGQIGADSLLSEQPLQAGSRLFSVLSPYVDYSGQPVTLFGEPIWNPHTRYTLTEQGIAVPHIRIWATRDADELLDGIRRYVAGEPWRRPEQYGQCMPEDAPSAVARLVGAVNMGDRDALGYLFPSLDHPGALVEPHADGGMRVFYGYSMMDETTGAVTHDGRNGPLIEHLLQRHAANERWYVQDFAFVENLDPALQLPDVTRGTLQIIREADDLPAITTLVDVWLNCLDGTILYARGWQEQAGVANGSLLGTDYGVFPSWPEWMVEGGWQRTTVDATRWRPVEVLGRPVEVVSYPELTISGGYVFGNAGCDMYNIALLRFAEGHVGYGEYSRWESYCGDKAVEDLEDRFFAALDVVSTYRVINDQLVFRDAAHEVVMVLARN